MDNPIELSVVIVEYHCTEQIQECLHTFGPYLAHLNWECTVVSNSEYGPAELADMRMRLPGAQVIANDRNRGYAGGVNRALPLCRAPFIFIINPDCRLIDDRVPDLVAFMKVNPEVAAIGPKIVDERGIVQPSCRRLPRPWTFLLVRSALRRMPGAARERRRYLMEDFDHSTIRDADWVSGGALLVRKAAIDIVGMMDERYFLYMEDVDWCRRFSAAGWRVVYVPTCTMIHAGQHASIQGGLTSLSSKHTRMHLASMSKYFLKYLVPQRANSHGGR